MVRNFLFHRVNPKRDILWDPMDVALFEKCIKYISNKYEVVPLEDIAFTNHLYSVNKYATIMFDDGYKDNIEYAAPILDKYKCKASFYVVTNCIDNNTLTWTHTLDYLFQHTNKQKIDLDFDFLPTELRRKKLLSTDDRIFYARKLKSALKKISYRDRRLVLDRIKYSYTDVKMPKLMMNWTDLTELKNAGHYIGSHTVTHAMLGTMTNEDEINNELLQSGNKIKQNLGFFPITISYPVGSYNEQIKILAQKAGYKLGLAVKQNIFNPYKEDLFEIPRIELYNESWFKTKLRISNTLENIKKIIGYK